MFVKFGGKNLAAGSRDEGSRSDKCREVGRNCREVREKQKER